MSFLLSLFSEGTSGDFAQGYSLLGKAVWMCLPLRKCYEETRGNEDIKTARELLIIDVMGVREKRSKEETKFAAWDRARACEGKHEDLHKTQRYLAGVIRNWNWYWHVIVSF